MIIKFIGEKPSNLNPVERAFTIKPYANNSLDWIKLNAGWHTERQTDGWALFSPTGKRMAINGYLELS